jgi:hypothetical protein
MIFAETFRRWPVIIENRPSGALSSNSFDHFAATHTSMHTYTYKVHGGYLPFLIKSRSLSFKTIDRFVNYIDRHESYQKPELVCYI